MPVFEIHIPAENEIPGLPVPGNLVTETAADDSASLKKIRFDESGFRDDFDAVVAFIKAAADVDDAEFVVGGKIRSRSFMVDLAGRVEANELQIRENQAAMGEYREGWGYPQLNSVNRYLPEHREALITDVFWFQLGTFSSPDIWVVDKNQIRAILKQEAEDSWLHLCPSFDFSKTEGIIDRLPDSIDVRDNPGWSVLITPQITGSRVIKRPSGILHKLTTSQLGGSGDGRKASSAKTDQLKRNIPKVSFGDIGGIDEIVSRVREVIELPLRNPALFRHMGIKPHKGVMLHGDPGCGKTMIAKAIAHEVNAHFISVKGPELLNKYYGQSEENLRTLFDEAAQMQPSIIFFDEIDAIAQKRSGADTLRMDARFVNQLLSLMDGIEDFGRVCIVAATNRIELLDAALLRPGRFDYRLEVKRPDLAGCRKIFEITTRDMPLHQNVNVGKISKKLQGMTGADIAYIAREAAYIRLRRTYNLNGNYDPEMTDKTDVKSLKIEAADFDEAIEKFRGTAEK